MSLKELSPSCPLRGVIDVGSCPAFQGRCPFSNAGANKPAQEDVASVLELMPNNHTDAQNENALAPQYLAAVVLLRQKLEDMKPRTVYITKTSTGEVLLDAMELLNNTRDVRLLAKPVALPGSTHMMISFASDIIATDCEEKHCEGYIVAMYTIYSALEDALIVASDGRVRGLHRPELARKKQFRLEISDYFKIEGRSVHDYLEEHFPSSAILRDIVKRIKHLLVVNPVLLIAYMYVMYAGTGHARDFRKGLRQCAPRLSRICLFRDLEAAPCPIEYQKSIDSLELTPDESDEIIMELKYLYKLQAALFYEFDTKRGKSQPDPKDDATIREALEFAVSRRTGSSLREVSEIGDQNGLSQMVTRIRRQFSSVGIQQTENSDAAAVVQGDCDNSYMLNIFFGLLGPLLISTALYYFLSMLNIVTI